MQAKMLVRYVNREQGGAGQPGGQPPRDSHLVGGRRIGERSECDADDKVCDADEYRRPEPLLVT